MNFFVEHFLLFLAASLLLSILFFRSARKGNMPRTEAWRNLFYILMSVSGLFLLLTETASVTESYLNFFYLLTIYVLLVPVPYLLAKALIGPLYFAFSPRSAQDKFNFLYVRLGAVERSLHLYLSILAVIMAVMRLLDLVQAFDLRLLVTIIVLFVSGAGLFLARNSLYAEILTNVAYLHMGRGDLDDSERFLERSLVIRRDLPKTWATLVEVMRRKGDYDAAGRYLRMLKRVSPSSRMTALLEVKLHYSRGRFADCVRTSKRVLKKYPDHSELMLFAGKASTAMGEYRQSLDFLESYERTAGDDAESLACKVEDYYRTGQYERSVESYELLGKLKGSSGVPGMDGPTDAEVDGSMKRTERFYGKARKKLVGQ